MWCWSAPTIGHKADSLRAVAEPVDDEYMEDGDDDTPQARGSTWERLSARWQPTPGQTGSTGRTTKWSVDRLDARERRYSFFASAAALVFGISIYVTETNDKHFHLAKNQFTPFTTLVVGLVAAAFLLAATFIGRRALVGFVALFTFLAFSSSAFILGVPFVILAAWLLYRSYKVQKAASAELRAGRAQASAKSETSAKASTRATSSCRLFQGGTEEPDEEDEGAGRPRAEQALHAKATGPAGAAPAEAVLAGTPGGQGHRLTDGASVRRCRSGAPSATIPSISVRRRTNERVVGSSPSARMHLDLGHHADHRGVDGQQEQPGLVPAHVAGVHLRLQELGRTTHERLDRADEPGGGRGAEPPRLTDQAEQLRSAGGQPEDRADHRLDPGPPAAGRGQ